MENETTIQEFANHVFLSKNVEKIQLTLECVETTKDLFCFLVDLLRHGLALLHGEKIDEDSNTVVNIDNITYDQFQVIRSKLKAIGIDIVLKVRDNESSMTPGSNLLYVVNCMPNNLDLQEYKFLIITKSYVYDLYFDMLRH